jgi:hypothetical protein
MITLRRALVAILIPRIAPKDEDRNHDGDASGQLLPPQGNSVKGINPDYKQAHD